MTKKHLMINIEILREKLNKLTQYRTLNDPGIIAISKEVDKLIVKFQKTP